MTTPQQSGSGYMKNKHWWALYATYAIGAISGVLAGRASSWCFVVALLGTVLIFRFADVRRRSELGH